MHSNASQNCSTDTDHPVDEVNIPVGDSTFDASLQFPGDNLDEHGDDSLEPTVQLSPQQAELARLRSEYLRDERFAEFMATISIHGAQDAWARTGKEQTERKFDLPILTHDEERSVFSSMYRLRFELVDNLLSGLTNDELQTELDLYFTSRLGEQFHADRSALNRSEKIWLRMATQQFWGLKKRWEELHSDLEGRHSVPINSFMRDNPLCSKIAIALAEQVGQELRDNSLLECKERFNLARGVIFVTHLRWAWSIATHFANKHSLKFCEGDIRREAEGRLYNAMEKFNLALGFRFTTYSRSWILEGCQSARRAVEEKQKIRSLRSHEALSQTNSEGQGPTDCDNVDLSHLTIGSDTYRTEPTIYSYDRVNNDGLSLMGQIKCEKPPPWAQASKNDIAERLYSALNMLPERDADIICKRFGLKEEPTLTLEEIGAIYRVTKERIRQIEAKCLKFIKSQL